jgi:hypothetical protein
MSDGLAPGPSNLYRASIARTTDRRLVDEPVDDLLALLERIHRHLSSRPELGSRQLAAAALVAAERHLRAIKLLAAEGLRDTVGIHLRFIWECWCLGNHLLLNGDDAALQLAGYHAWRLAQLASEFPVAEGETHPLEGLVDFNAPRVDLNLRELGPKVEAEIQRRERGRIEFKEGISSYGILYRFESTWSSHAGFGTFSKYIVNRPDPGPIASREEFEAIADQIELQEVSLERALKSGPADAGLAFAALWVAMLARAVCKAFGIGVEELEAIIHELYARGNEATDTP